MEFCIHIPNLQRTTNVDAVMFFPFDATQDVDLPRKLLKADHKLHTARSTMQRPLRGARATGVDIWAPSVRISVLHVVKWRAPFKPQEYVAEAMMRVLT